MEKLNLTQQTDLKIFSAKVEPSALAPRGAFSVAYSAEDAITSLAQKFAGKKFSINITGYTPLKPILDNIALEGINKEKLLCRQCEKPSDTPFGSCTECRTKNTAIKTTKDQFVANLKLVADRYIKTKKDKEAILKILEKI